jgi:hypothetical protein
VETVPFLNLPADEMVYISFVVAVDVDLTNWKIAFGCTLKADISPLASEPNIREYRVEVEYRTKADAKAAVVCLAAEQGLIDLLRFNGAQPPPDYTLFWEAQVNGTGDNYVGKRKESERDLDGEGRDRKKRRKGNKDSSFEPTSFPSVMHPPQVVYGAGPAFQSGPAPMFTSSDFYQGAYASYPPAVQGYPYQQATPHPPYPYFAVPSSPPHPPSVAPTHMPYAHYPYPQQYLQPYPHGHYPVNYGPHPHVMCQAGPAVIPVSSYTPVAAAIPPPPPTYPKFASSPPPPLESTRSPPSVKTNLVLLYGISPCDF